VVRVSAPREDFDFHTYWSITKPPEDDHDQWIARHQVELHRVLAAAEAQQHLPPNWQAWADAEPEVDHPIPDAVAFLLLGFLALIVPTLIVVAAWHWLVQ